MKQFIAVLFLIFTCLRMVDAGGLVLYTTRGSSYVSAVQYETFSSPSAHLSYVTVKGGNRLQIQTAGIVAQIPFPDSSVTVASEDAEAAISQAEIYAARYPQYAELLQSVGELWKRKLEAIKLAQAQPTPSASVSQNTGPKTSSEGATSEIPVVRTRSGQTLKNVRITRFEDDKAVITHDGGIGRLLISDIADTSAFPGDVKAAIEKAQAATVAVNKAEADRVAAEKRENERFAREAEERKQAEAKQSLPGKGNTPGQKTFVVTGMGVDAGAARKNAFTHAIEEAIGAVVDSQTLVQNEQVISENILTYSDGFISESKIIREWQENDLANVEIRVTVELRPLTAKLHEANIKTQATVSGESLFATAVTQSDKEQNAFAMVREALRGFPVNILKVELVGKPTVSKNGGNDTDIIYDARLSVDRQKYQTFIVKLRRTLEDTGHVGVSSILHATDYLYSPHPNANDEFNQWARQGISYKLAKAFTSTPSSNDRRCYLFINIASDRSDQMTQWVYYQIEPEMMDILYMLSSNSLKLSMEFKTGSGSPLYTDEFGSHTSSNRSYSMGLPISFWFPSSESNQSISGGPSTEGSHTHDVRPEGNLDDTRHNDAIGLKKISAWSDSVYNNSKAPKYVFISPYFTFWEVDGSSCCYALGILVRRQIKVLDDDLLKISEITGSASSVIELPPDPKDFPNYANSYLAELVKTSEPQP